MPVPDTKVNPQIKPEKPKELPVSKSDEKPPEFGGRGGLEPTRYGDWESGGRCTDF